jgi:hypothetical protein
MLRTRLVISTSVAPECLVESQTRVETQFLTALFVYLDMPLICMLLLLQLCLIVLCDALDKAPTFVDWRCSMKRLFDCCRDVLVVFDDLKMHSMMCRVV